MNKYIHDSDTEGYKTKCEGCGEYIVTGEYVVELETTKYHEFDCFNDQIK